MKEYDILNANTKKFQLFNENIHTYPFVINIPHSGTLLLEKMYNNLIENTILANMDWYLPQLYSFLSDMGFTVIINNISRYVIDVNRSLDDKNSNFSYNKNLIYIKTTFDKDMYKNTLSQDEMTERIDNYYVPYHKEIEKLLKEKLKYFEKVYLIDLHSFSRNIGSDIVLGNNCGKTTSNNFFEIMKNSLEKCGFIVSSNKPYKGGYITKNYREKFNNCETLQIKLYYGTYIDNREFIEEYKPTVNNNVFYNTQRKMMRVFEKMKKII